jgi:hypothetical protein
LTHPATYDFALPLRTIYTLNSTTPHTSPADFKLLLMEHISNLPSQPCTLPPSFLSTFVRKCFPQDLANVDFDQALTALDYIRDLENRRKQELEKAAKARGEGDRRIEILRNKSFKTEQFYARAIAGIRRWVCLFFYFFYILSRGLVGGLIFFFSFLQKDLDQRIIAGTIQQVQLHRHPQHALPD